jgi:replicative DNA helicase
VTAPSQFIAKQDVERSILGAVLLNNKHLYECAGLKAEHFGLGDNRRIFARMQELDACGKPIDLLTLSDALRTHGELDAIPGGVDYLDELSDGVPDRPSIKHYVDMVRDAAKRRALQDSCENLIAKLQDPGIDTNQCIAEQEDLLLRLRAAGGVQKVSHVREIVPTVLNEMALQRKHSGELIGLSTGIETIDFMTTGIRPGEYWVVGAAPSRGKTVLGGQIGATTASKGIATLVFSIEMTKEQFVKRMLPKYARLPAWLIRDFRTANDQQQIEAEEAGAQIAQWPIYVVDPEGMTAAEIAATSRLYIRQHEVKLIVVDYLQIIGGQEHEVRHRVANASNVLRGVAKTEKVAVVALSQLRRPSDETQIPSMFDLKETGDIEAHAQTILLIHRPSNEKKEWTGEDLLVIAKQREGLVGAQPVLLDSKKLWFVDREVVAR